LRHAGDVGTDIAPEVADDPELAAGLDDLLHRTCSLARALTGAEQAALKVDLDGDGHAARKFFSMSASYAPWRDYRVDPSADGRDYGLLQLSYKSGGADFTAQDEDGVRELAAFAGAALDAFHAARR
jgi:hypothetical protein